MWLVFLIVCGASFLSPKNIMNILNQMALPLVVALGLTFVIMLGSIDLSIDGAWAWRAPVCLLCPQQ